MNELENNDHQNDSHGDIEQPPAPIKRTHSAVNDSTGSNQSRKKETNWPQRIEAVCAVLLVIITGFYTFYARKQLKAMQGQIAEMKNARAQSKLDNANAISAQQAIAQSGLSASQESGKQSLGATIGNFHLDQRAWIGAVSFALDAVEIGKPVYGHVTLFNSGKTVAKHVIPHFHMMFSPTEFKKLPPPSGPQPIVGSVGVVAPTAQYPSKFGNPINAQEIDKQNVANWYTYIWGEITYVDIFQKTHLTVFCSYRKGTEGDFLQCPFHNDAN